MPARKIPSPTGLIYEIRLRPHYLGRFEHFVSYECTFSIVSIFRKQRLCIAKWPLNGQIKQYSSSSRYCPQRALCHNCTITNHYPNLFISVTNIFLSMQENISTLLRPNPFHSFPNSNLPKCSTFPILLFLHSWYLPIPSYTPSSQGEIPNFLPIRQERRKCK